MKRRESESNTLNLENMSKSVSGASRKPSSAGLSASERSLLLFRVAGQMGIGDANTLPYMAGLRSAR